MEATPLQTTFYKEQKQQMKIRIVGHNMKYEAECITMLFFPDEKIVTTEYPPIPSSLSRMRRTSSKPGSSAA